jgi:hypothetical protein
MNKTLYNTIYAPTTREIYTSDIKSRDPLLMSFRQTMTPRSGERKYHSQHCNIMSTHRPSSSATIDSTVSYCKPKEGEQFLKQSIKNDLNKYLIRRISGDTKRHEQSLTEQKMELPNQLELWF